MLLRHQRAAAHRGVSKYHPDARRPLTGRLRVERLFGIRLHGPDRLREA